MKALVTGASGFIGSTLVPELRTRGWEVITAGRTPTTWPEVGSIILDRGYAEAEWDLRGFDVIFHLAGRAHVRGGDMASAHRDNVEVPRRLVAAASRAGISRFVYVSTLKVHGEGGLTPYKETDLPAPEGHYAITKLEAEEVVRSARGEGLVSTIIRPPLVYGAGVRANFLALMERVQRGKPIPAPRSPNRRSLISARNLCDALIKVATDPVAADETFLVSDGVDISTEDLSRTLASHLGVRPRIWTVPDFLSPLLTSMFPSPFRQLLGSLTADISHLLSTGWSPPYAVDEELRQTALWYRSGR